MLEVIDHACSITMLGALTGHVGEEAAAALNLLRDQPAVDSVSVLVPWLHPEDRLHVFRLQPERLESDWANVAAFPPKPFQIFPRYVPRSHRSLLDSGGHLRGEVAWSHNIDYDTVSIANWALLELAEDGRERKVLWTSSIFIEDDAPETLLHVRRHLLLACAAVATISYSPRSEWQLRKYNDGQRRIREVPRWRRLMSYIPRLRHAAASLTKLTGDGTAESEELRSLDTREGAWVEAVTQLVPSGCALYVSAGPFMEDGWNLVTNAGSQKDSEQR